MKHETKKTIQMLIIALLLIAGVVALQVYTYSVWKKNNPSGNYWEYIITRGG